MIIPNMTIRQVLLACLLIAASTSAGARRELNSRVRIDAYGWVRWSNAPIDPSKGVEKFHFRLNAANGGRTSGGFGISVPGRLNGTIHELVVDGASIKPNAAGPPKARAFGEGEFGGRRYAIEAIVVGDYSRPPVGANKRGAYVPGSVHFKLIGPITSGGKGKPTGPVQEARSVEGTQVRYEIRWSEPRGRGRTGGAMTAEPGPRR